MERSEILNDLAAVFRWTAKLNMHEGIANHFSVCAPDSNEDFYINVTGMHFSNIKASDLVFVEQKKIDEIKKNPSPNRRWAKTLLRLLVVLALS